MSNVRVSQFAVSAKNFVKNDDDSYTLTKGPHTEMMKFMGQAHKRSWALYSEEGYNTTRVYACIPLYRDKDTKEYYMVDTEGNRLTGIKWFEDDVTIPIGE
jgi:hypothetical protein